MKLSELETLKREEWIRGVEGEHARAEQWRRWEARERRGHKGPKVTLKKYLRILDWLDDQDDVWVAF